MRKARSKRERAARQLPFLIANHTAVHIHIEIAQPIATVRHSRCRSAIAHERNSFDAFGLQKQLHRRAVHVNAIGDEFCRQFL